LVGAAGIEPYAALFREVAAMRDFRGQNGMGCGPRETSGEAGYLTRSRPEVIDLEVEERSGVEEVDLVVPKLHLDPTAVEGAVGPPQLVAESDGSHAAAQAV